jgi:photosystem II stability/assembly factor-like uncharacterized protein
MRILSGKNEPMKVFALCLFTLLASAGMAQQVDMSIFSEMKMRQIGPAGMSGRITCIDAVASSPEIMFVGAASGGVWKSVNGGTSWTPVGDSMPTLNIGALAIQQSNPSVIWVGTGEGNPRNSQSSGRGIYRSLDGGKTWENKGLNETRNIHRVLIHPHDPNTIWVGAQGPAWGDNSNRGVYKTTDGGKTWRQVLAGNESTGIGELVLDPNNPNKLLASLWDFRRNPWSFRSGGKGSGLFVSVDGGESWKQRTDADGLPEGELGRIGLAIAPSNSNRIYALVEAKKNELYRSDDGGVHWRKISSDHNAGDRPFYYSDIFVDPLNENRVYSLWTRVSRSEDGGETWKIIIPYNEVHPDFHAWYIHPQNPNFLMVGNDGGLAISRDRGESWHYAENIPVAQYYHINVDNELPYNIYGGMQDNGSWRGPAYVWAAGGIRNAYFEEVMFGDGFDVVPDPEASDRYGYAMSQEGNLGRYDLLTGHTKDIQPVASSETKLRFNWNAPIAQDPFDTATIYYGSQFVHRSTNRGDAWEQLSDDLTSNDTNFHQQHKSGGLTPDVTGAENYTTLTVIEPSTAKKGVIWTGSDDGRIHITLDGGAHWQSVEKNIKGMPDGAWVPQIHASKHNADEAFVVVNDYRRNNWKPYVFHTTNAGKTWKQLAKEGDFEGYCLSIIQDPVVPELLFLGTEHGLFVSFDKGANWNAWKHGYPNVSTMDMKIQERERDLVIGTFGRAAYVLDDIEPLRRFAKEGKSAWDAQKMVAFAVPVSYQAEYKRAPGTRFAAAGIWSGENRTSSARIQVYFHKADGKLKKGKKAEGYLRVMNAAGDTIRTMKIELAEGLNRLEWGQEQKRSRAANSKKSEKQQTEDEASGFPVLPGVYSVEIECDSVKVKTSAEVRSDPRMDIQPEDLARRQAQFEETQQIVAQLTEACDQLRECLAVIERVGTLLPVEKNEAQKALEKSGKQLQDSLQTMLEEVVGKKDQKGINRNEEEYNSIVNRVQWHLWGNLSGNEQRYTILKTEAENAAKKVRDAVQHLMENEWATYRKKVEEAALSPFRE